MIDRTTELAKAIISQMGKVHIAVDMTAGNGHDSNFILDQCQPEILYAFDIQESAKESTLELIGDKENVSFILDSHENIDQYITGPIDLAVYNLGYLPGGDKNITTNWESTIKSLEKTIALLHRDGKIVITIYPGHPAGAIEAEKIEAYLSSLDQKEYAILKLNYINQINNPPYVIVIGKK